MSKTQSNRSVPKVVPAAPIQKPEHPQEDWRDACRRQRLEASKGLNLLNLEDDERAFLGTCQRLYHNFHGCSTPFEEFFWSLVGIYTTSGAPTPDCVTGELETFRTNFKDMKRDVDIFMKNYPEVFYVQKEAA